MCGMSVRIFLILFSSSTNLSSAYNVSTSIVSAIQQKFRHQMTFSDRKTDRIKLCQSIKINQGARNNNAFQHRFLSFLLYKINIETTFPFFLRFSWPAFFPLWSLRATSVTSHRSLYIRFETMPTLSGGETKKKWTDRKCEVAMRLIRRLFRLNRK